MRDQTRVQMKQNIIIREMAISEDVRHNFSFSKVAENFLHEVKTRGPWVSGPANFFMDDPMNLGESLQLFAGNIFLIT